MDASTGDIVIIGRACRLPGARNVAEFWQLLAARGCSVTSVPADRWSLDVFYHPRRGEPGKSYTFAAGVIEGIWDFDPAPFGISIREAEQMDPQQRLVLEVVWEALEDAGLRPAELAGGRVGVFVGVSGCDSAQRRVVDIAGSDPYLMTGNTLSLVANRVSHVFDFKGPSFIVDTACSSSLVALREATVALAAGEIDMAIVAGVNVLLSPFPFVGFSAAQMLSPDGRCRPFDANGNGYVRSEGAVAFLLRREGAALPAGDRRYARILAAGVNSDGRTRGVSLPSREAQAALLREVYASVGLAPDDLAFVEAHGTGTRAGDPVEAGALCDALGLQRILPLPIGSVKSNIGHLEPASGLAGVLKAMLALEHDLLPASINFEAPHPDIPLEDLNLTVAASPMPLPRGERPRLAGISSFGFGGTNAHVVIADAATSPAPERPSARAASAARALFLSAPDATALAQTAARHAAALRGASADEFGDWAAAAAHAREHMPQRLVVLDAQAPELADALEMHARGRTSAGIVSGRAVTQAARTAFVFSGNGSQWAGMGRVAFARNHRFARSLRRTDKLFQRRAGWSLIEALQADDLEERLKSTEIAQPLLFALQVALTDALVAGGLEPDIVLGHSVGEVAAAYAAGALTRADAVGVIHARSTAQERARGAGAMAALQLSPELAHARLADDAFAGVELAAINSPAAVTIAGPRGDVERFAATARAEGVRCTVLDLDYPFHCTLMEPARAPLAAALAGLAPAATTRSFISTVTGQVERGEDLNAGYWWRNVRAPVRFAEAVARAAELGAEVFVEIGPRPVLQSYLNDSLRERAGASAVLSSLRRADEPGIDPVAHTLAQALVRGSRIDLARLVGDRPRVPKTLPGITWQRAKLRPRDTEELVDTGFTTQRDAPHPLLGRELRPSEPVWVGLLDTLAAPALADHTVRGRVLVPGAALAELALAAGRRWTGADAIELRDFDIVAPLALTESWTAELRVRLTPESGRVEIASRPRLSAEAWQLHAAGRVAAIEAVAGRAPDPRGREADAEQALGPGEIYAKAGDLGLNYGPSFRRARRVVRRGRRSLEVEIAPSPAPLPALELDLFGLDAAFHGLLALLADEGSAFVPVRFGALRLHCPGTLAASARIDIRKADARSMLADLEVHDAEGAVVVRLEGARFKALAREEGELVRHGFVITTAGVEGSTAPARLPAEFEVGWTEKDEEARLLLEAGARRLAWDVLHPLATNCRIPRRLPGSAYVASLLRVIEEAGLADPDAEGWRLATESGLPELAQIIATVSADYPAWSAESVLLARAADVAHDVVRAQEGVGDERVFGAATLEHLWQDCPRARARIDGVLAGVRSSLGGWPADQPVRIVELGAAGTALTRRLAPLVANGRGKLLAVADDAPVLGALRAAFAETIEVDAVEGGRLGEHAGEAAPFDILVAANGLHGLASTETRLAQARALLRGGGLLFLGYTEPDAFHDVVLGLLPAWFERSLSSEFPVGALRSAEEWRICLERAGFDVVKTHALAGKGSGLGIILARARASGAANVIRLGANRRVRLGTIGALTDRGLLARLGAELAARGVEVAHGRNKANLAAVNGAHHEPGRTKLNGAEPRQDVVLLARMAETERDESGAIAVAMLEIRDVLASFGDARGRLWLLLPGGAAGIAPGQGGGAAAAALWAFARAAANEFAGVEIRLVDWLPELSEEQAGARIAELVLHPTPEFECVVGRTGLNALRVARWQPEQQSRGSHQPDESALVRLETRGGGAGLDRLAWVAGPRRVPASGEVEIEVAAAGLNFRDVMWTLGLLPDEALEEGFAGATLGFECAGRVTAVGPDVAGIAVGAQVIAMAPAALASHVTVAARAVLPAPTGLEPAAAATIPVAFLTAYYALHHLGCLTEGECVLIHGAAGAVGLAALQIARWRGARVIATAGTAEKRSFLSRLGADVTLDSRSLAFVDEVRRVTGGAGVDVVLNSLSGEAMERSLELVRPFGRFLELGKRDYYANTSLALRPFRCNVSYFGIDADQLLVAKPELAARLLSEVATLFAAGSLTPLPYRRFDAGEVVAAFRLMQQSGHIGKIVITPPDPASCARATPNARFRPDCDGWHVVVGGLGGFGFATADRLARRGARHIAVVSRSGEPQTDAADRIAELRRHGCEIEICACDVTDRAAVSRMLDSLRRSRPVKGILHAAMVLDDALLSNLSAERMTRVLAPKVEGARNLDALSRSDPLDYFVLYSSVTALIGNPGQAAYVAANAYLEQLARERRRAGLPALAMAWGAISDVGYLARDTQAAAALASRTGGATLSSGRALDALEQLLAEPGRDPTQAAVVLAPMSWARALRALPRLASPTYALLQRRAEIEGETLADERDLLAAVASLSDGEARSAILAALSRELAVILRVPAETLHVQRPIAELGMDSLMGAELHVAIRDRLGLDLPMAALSENVTLADLAERALARARQSAPGAPAIPRIEATVVQQHVAEALGEETSAAAVTALAAWRAGEREIA
jgi:acyl transferase domain-containing protein/NADPH:quinone reductase-like Zn-dependent oxidoreductase